MDRESLRAALSRAGRRVAPPKPLPPRDVGDLDLVVVHYLSPRASAAMLTSLFRHYPEARVTLVDNSGGRSPADRTVLAHLPRLRERVRTIPNPARDHGVTGDLSHGAGLDLALAESDRRYLVSLESDTIFLDRGPLEYLLHLMDRGFDWAGAGIKPVAGRFAGFSPSFAIFRRSLIERYGLSFRRRDRPPELRDRSDPVIRHHVKAARRARLRLRPVDGKPPDTYREPVAKVVARELEHLTYFDTGEWVHRILTEKGHRGHLFRPPPGVRHVWGSRDEAGFLANFAQRVPETGVNELLPPALKLSTDLEPVPLPRLAPLAPDGGGSAGTWHWVGGTPERWSVRGGRLRFRVDTPESGRFYLSLGPAPFDLPPPARLRVSMAGGRLHRVECHLRSSGPVEARIWVIEYASGTRVRDHRRTLRPGSNPLHFVSDGVTTAFRILFRFRGRGRVSLGRLRLEAGGPPPHQ